MMSEAGDKPVAVIGAGGHGRVVLHALCSAGRHVIHLTDLEPQRFPEGIDGVPVCSDDELLRKFQPDEIELALGVGSVGPIAEDHIRRKIVDRMQSSGYEFPVFVHQAAWVAESVTLQQGVQIHAGAIVQPGSNIGAFGIINTGATIDHDCSLAEFVHVAPGAVLSGDVTIGEGTHVGAGATVIQGIHIGTESLIAAGAVVVRNVEDHCRVIGVPARRC